MGEEEEKYMCDMQWREREKKSSRREKERGKRRCGRETVGKKKKTGNAEMWRGAL